MNDIKKNVYNGFCITGVIVAFIIFGICGFSLSEKMRNRGKLSRDVKWEAEFKKATESRSYGRGDWNGFLYMGQ
jgi:hypothetical protein